MPKFRNDIALTLSGSRGALLPVVASERAEGQGPSSNVRRGQPREDSRRLPIPLLDPTEPLGEWSVGNGPAAVTAELIQPAANSTGML
jgi:hypothetical protein